MLKKLAATLVLISVLYVQASAFSLLEQCKMDKWLILDIVYGTEDNIA
jgi:hypothetical protein